MTLPAGDPVLLPYPSTIRVVPFSDAATLAFLLDVNDIDDTILLWDRKSGYPGLLNAKPKYPVAQFQEIIYEVVFDDHLGRYRYMKTGRFISIDQVRLGMYRVAKSQEQVMDDLTQMLIDGEITERQWYLQMRKAMKDEYRSAWLASIGGRANYTASEISRFGHAMRPHYRWLDNFLLEIQTGEQKLNAFARRRARMYARAANTIYQNGILGIARRMGKKFARRILGETDDHCHDDEERPGCVELAALGYVPIMQAVPIGEAACYTNCLCQWMFK